MSKPSAEQVEAGPEMGPAEPSAPERRVTPIQLLLWLVLGASILSIFGFALWYQVKGVAGDRLGPGRGGAELPVLAKVPDFELIDRDGSAFGLDDLIGAPWIADLIFTRCAAICPRMTHEMSQVVKALGPGSRVQIVSISVDPEHDTPAVLDAWAKGYGATESWHFLTGEVEAIHTLAIKGLLLGVDAQPPPGATTGGDVIVHSNRFVLVDDGGRIRGYYDPFDPESVGRLLGDLRRLERR